MAYLPSHRQDGPGVEANEHQGEPPSIPDRARGCVACAIAEVTARRSARTAAMSRSRSGTVRIPGGPDNPKSGDDHTVHRERRSEVGEHAVNGAEGSGVCPRFLEAPDSGGHQRRRVFHERSRDLLRSRLCSPTKYGPGNCSISGRVSPTFCASVGILSRGRRDQSPRERASERGLGARRRRRGDPCRVPR
jgi:hypothetical protein